MFLQSEFWVQAVKGFETQNQQFELGSETSWESVQLIQGQLMCFILKYTITVEYIAHGEEYSVL